MTKTHSFRGLSPGARIAHPGTRIVQVFIAAACVVLLPRSGWAADELAAMDREMAFMDKSIEATELYNQQDYARALAAFQYLLDNYPDLDLDGYVVTSLADCLHALGSLDEARAMYEYAAQVNPAVADSVKHRLRELRLAGSPDDAFIAELRTAIQAESRDAYVLKVQLGRAIQKRAMALLKEAVAVFQDAAKTDIGSLQPSRSGVASQAEMLAEIEEDLSTLLARMERAFAGCRNFREIEKLSRESSSDGTKEYRASWRAQTPEGIEVGVEATIDGCTVNLTADGKAVPLNSTQRLIIRRHQERINAVLLEALKAGSSQDQQTSEAPKQ